MAAMEDVPKDILRQAYKRNSLYLLKIPFLFGLWAAALGVLLLTKDLPLYVFVPIGVACSVLIANVIRGLGSTAHDAVHGTVSTSKFWSYVISLICWSPTGMSVTLYSNYHLHHHKIANTYPDVDNFVVTDYTRNPFFAKVILLTVYSFAYPMYFATCMGRYTKRLTSAQKVRMVVELAGIFSMIIGWYLILPAKVFFFFFALPFILGAILASVTSMIEHYEMLPGDNAYSSRTYGTKAHLTNFIWNNVSYHNEHHNFPGIPWYNLRSFHEAAYPYYDKKVQSECYTSIWPLAFSLYGRILKLDIAKLDERYKGINLEEDRQRHMAMPGIQPEAG